jgi:hypothetical protein
VTIITRLLHTTKHKILKLKHVAFIALSSHGVTPGPHHLPLSIFKTWSHILSLWDLFPSAPNFRETLTVAIKQGGTAGAAISVVIETIDSIISTILFLIIDWSP